MVTGGSRMTERYARLAMGNLKSAVSRLDRRAHSGHSALPQQIRSVVAIEKMVAMGRFELPTPAL